MSVLCLWKILVFSFWFQAFLSGICCSVGNTWTVSQLSKEDVLALKDEENPKCFSRTGGDFTCFFETAENNTFDLFYSVSRVPRTRCEMTVHGTEDGTFLHVCSLPGTHVFLYTDTKIQVVDRTNTTIYSRTVNVENHYLLKPPFKVSAKPNGHVGQLDVSWDAEIPENTEDDDEYRVRYSSSSVGEKTIRADKKSLQLSLEPGEEVEVQVAVRLAFSEETGHWSSWSQPVRVSVPQSADKVTLGCTFDLQNITCDWNGTAFGANDEYKLFYKMSFGDSLQWTDWAECVAADEVTDTCSFRGDGVKKIKLELDGTSDAINRTFFSEALTLNNLIKTAPPRHLKGGQRKDKLCLEWEAPPLSLSNHDLQYEVNVQIRGGEQWSIIKGPNTDTCVKVPSGSQLSVKIRAKPTGSIYWSNWSGVFTCKTPAEDYKDLLLLWCVLVPVLILATSFICVISLHHSKLKQYFWPAVPNLEKVLQDFLTDINQQKWGPPVISKQCFEETTSSVVEIMSEDEIPGSLMSGGETSELLSSDENLSAEEQLDGSPGTKVLPDYVTLSKDLAFICVGENSYVYEQVAESEDPEVGDDVDSLQAGPGSCADASTGVRLCSGNNYFNHSYLTTSKSAETLNSRTSAENAAGNHYTNLSLC